MKKRNVILASVTTIAILVSGSVMAFAATDSTTAAGIAGKVFGHNKGQKAETVLNLTEEQMAVFHQEKADIMETALATLVSSGILTQAEADTIIANRPPAPPTENDSVNADKPAVPPAGTDRPEGDKGPFQDLTEAQRTALQDEIKTLETSSINQLVTDGTITQAQADEFLAMKAGPMSGPEGRPDRGPDCGTCPEHGPGHGPGNEADPKTL